MIKIKIKHWGKIIIFALSFFVVSSIMMTESFAQDIAFRKIVPRPNGCVVILGGVGFSDGFLINKCGSIAKINKLPDIPYIKQFQFISNDTAWGVAASSLVKFQFRVEEMVMDPVKLNNPEWQLEDVFFINESIGWACGEDGLILKTIDGGQTWKKMESGTDVFLRDIRFTDNNFGWATGRGNKQGSEYAFLTTDDGGETWNDVSLPENKTIMSAFFTSSVHGCGVAGRGDFLCTANGKNWESVKLSSQYRSRVFFLDQQSGWAVGDSIVKTVNQGKTWTYSLKAANADRLKLDDVYFSNKQTGWAWGLSSVYETRDGGISWERVSDKWLPEIKKANVSNASSARIKKIN
jgi:photosystem II stability/assembly factor-like uncharacterized protein